VSPTSFILVLFGESAQGTIELFMEPSHAHAMVLGIHMEVQGSKEHVHEAVCDD
jgi:hypothetical protein